MDDITAGHVFIATSLDGFIAREDGGLDWLVERPTGGADLGYARFMARMDGLVMGQGSYDKVLTFESWPYDKPVVVLSRTLDPASVPTELSARVRIMDLAPVPLMRRLHAEGWRHAYVDGGQVIRSFLREGLIEDMILTTAPVLIGTGIPLFGDVDGDLELTLLRAEAHPSGFAQAHYRVG